MKKLYKKRGLFFYSIIYILLLIANILIARFGVIAYNVGPGVSSFYLSVAFMIAFTLWFGFWGVIAAYLGCIIGAGFSFPIGVNLYWSVADIWQVLIPFLAFKFFKADIGLKTKKDFFIFIIFGWILNNLVGAAWGTSTLAIGGIVPWEKVPGMFWGWFIPNLIVTIAITPLLLRYLTPRIQKTGMLVKNYWK